MFEGDMSSSPSRPCRPALQPSPFPSFSLFWCGRPGCSCFIGKLQTQAGTPAPQPQPFAYNPRMSPPPDDPLRIAILAAGAAGMYCGSCIRDNALAMALKNMGHDCVMIPLYT